jgi:hypothetical protein
LSNIIKKILVSYLSKELRGYVSPQKGDFDKIIKIIKPGDVILVEGKQIFSKAIKYLTQSNWSHSAIYIGDEKLIEADLKEGVRIIPLQEYMEYHTRICRPKNLSEADLDIVLNFARSKIGGQYDTKHVSDLFKISLNPRLNLRKVLIKLGSSDPRKAICSSLIADAFQSIHYPILPIKKELGGYQKINSTLITPSDFDLSPYFYIIKPTLEKFNYHNFFKSE